LCLSDADTTPKMEMAQKCAGCKAVAKRKAKKRVRHGDQIETN